MESEIYKFARMFLDCSRFMNASGRLPDKLEAAIGAKFCKLCGSPLEDREFEYFLDIPNGVWVSGNNRVFGGLTVNNWFNMLPGIADRINLNIVTGPFDPEQELSSSGIFLWSVDVIWQAYSIYQVLWQQGDFVETAVALLGVSGQELADALNGLAEDSPGIALDVLLDGCDEMDDLQSYVHGACYLYAVSNSDPDMDLVSMIRLSDQDRSYYNRCVKDILDLYHVPCSMDEKEDLILSEGAKEFLAAGLDVFFSAKYYLTDENGGYCTGELSMVSSAAEAEWLKRRREFLDHPYYPVMDQLYDRIINGMMAEGEHCVNMLPLDKYELGECTTGYWFENDVFYAYGYSDSETPLFDRKNYLYCLLIFELLWQEIQEEKGVDSHDDFSSCQEMPLAV